MDDTKSKIKEMLVRRLKLTIPPDEIQDDQPLFGDGLSLDSIDALEIVVGLQKEFGCNIVERSAAEKILVDVNSITDFIKNSQKH